jgi:hypothetical protein
LGLGWGWPYWYPYGSYGYSQYYPGYYPDYNSSYPPYGYPYPDSDEPPPTNPRPRINANPPTNPSITPTPQSGPDAAPVNDIIRARLIAQQAIRAANNMPPYAFPRRVDSGQYADFTPQVRKPVNNSAQSQLAGEKQ